jgi:hypothetical protein
MSRSRVVGGLLLAAAFVVLLAGADKPFSAWNLLAFLACFAAGGLLLLGAARLPGLGPAGQPRTFPPPSDAPPLTCRPPVSKAGLRVATALAVALVVLGLLLAGPVAFRMQAAWADMVALAGVPLASGVLLLAYLRRHRHVQFLAARDGLDARGYWHHVEAPWNEVRALSSRETWAFGPPATVYTVHTSRGAVSFFSTWPHAVALAEQIATRSGLTWSDE